MDFSVTMEDDSEFDFNWDETREQKQENWIDELLDGIKENPSASSVLSPEKAQRLV